MPKLSDTQLVILSAAAARDDGAVLPLPDSLNIKGGAVTSVLNSLLKKDLIVEHAAARGAEIWRETEDGGRVALAITNAGLQAIGVTPEDEVEDAVPADEPVQQESNDWVDRTSAAEEPGNGAAPSARPGTKQAMLIDLLRRKDGATIDEIVTATGWQAHSVRGAISGSLKKKLGLTVTSEKEENRGRVYRIVGEGQ